MMDVKLGYKTLKDWVSIKTFSTEEKNKGENKKSIEHNRKRGKEKRNGKLD